MRFYIAGGAGNAQRIQEINEGKYEALLEALMDKPLAEIQELYNHLLSLPAAERDDIKVGKVNVDEQRALTEKFGIMNIPTLLVFKGGSAAGGIVGFKPKEEMLAQL